MVAVADTELRWLDTVWHVDLRHVDLVVLLTGVNEAIAAARLAIEAQMLAVDTVFHVVVLLLLVEVVLVVVVVVVVVVAVIVEVDVGV